MHRTQARAASPFRRRRRKAHHPHAVSYTHLDVYKRQAEKVIVCCTFGLFTNGLEKFDEFHTQGYLDYVITTNLNYRTPDLLKRDWYLEADMGKYLAAIINALNHDRSISSSLSPTEKIQKLVQKYQNGGYEYSQKLV